MRVIIAAVSLAALAATSAQAEQVWLTMDQVRPYELEKPAGQIVVGNPAIADVTVHDKNRVFLFGKAPGLTNIVIFDDEGKPIDNLVIRVRATGNDMLTMHRGVARTTYNCTNQCEATITVGDGTTSFSSVVQQVSQRQTGADSSGSN
jgi:Flp pilus assembly secretin CpaC